MARLALLRLFAAVAAEAEGKRALAAAEYRQQYAPLRYHQSPRAFHCWRLAPGLDSLQITITNKVLRTVIENCPDESDNCPCAISRCQDESLNAMGSRMVASGGSGWCRGEIFAVVTPLVDEGCQPYPGNSVDRLAEFAQAMRARKLSHATTHTTHRGHTTTRSTPPPAHRHPAASEHLAPAITATGSNDPLQATDQHIYIGILT
eukprot:COSAG06_NODE_3161_length_5755_cov_3.280941_2_plen_205_part_00